MRNILTICLGVAIGLGATPGQAQFEDLLKKGKEQTEPAIKKIKPDDQDAPTTAPKNVGSELANDNNNTELVKAAQTELERLGYNVSVDGPYGPGTASAIRQAESEMGRTQIGNVTFIVVEALRAHKRAVSPKKMVPGSFNQTPISQIGEIGGQCTFNPLIGHCPPIC